MVRRRFRVVEPGGTELWQSEGVARRELDARCPFCGDIARAPVAGVICHAVGCACGAIALGAPPWDGDEITDDAIGYFQLSVHPLTVNLAPVGDWFGERGVEVADGGTIEDALGRPVSWRWFKRVALGPAAGWRPPPSDTEALAQARSIAASATARMESAREADQARIAYHEACAALFAVASYAQKLGCGDEAATSKEEIRRLAERFRALAAGR